MEVRIGKVTHYYNRIRVAVLKLDGELKVGDTILFLGHSTDFGQPVTSMEIEHRKVQSVPAGSEVAVQVIQPVRTGDKVVKVTGVEDTQASPG